MRGNKKEKNRNPDLRYLIETFSLNKNRVSNAIIKASNRDETRINPLSKDTADRYVNGETKMKSSLWHLAMPEVFQLIRESPEYPKIIESNQFPWLENKAEEKDFYAGFYERYVNGDKTIGNTLQRLALPQLYQMIRDSPEYPKISKSKKSNELDCVAEEKVFFEWFSDAFETPKDSEEAKINIDNSTNLNGFVHGMINAFERIFVLQNRQGAYRLRANFLLFSEVSYSEMVILTILSIFIKKDRLSELYQSNVINYSAEDDFWANESFQIPQWKEFLFKNYDCGGEFDAVKRFEQIKSDIYGGKVKKPLAPIKTLIALFAIGIFWMFDFTKESVGLTLYYVHFSNQDWRDVVNALLNDNCSYSLSEIRKRRKCRVNSTFRVHEQPRKQQTISILLKERFYQQQLDTVSF